MAALLIYLAAINEAGGPGVNRNSFLQCSAGEMEAPPRLSDRRRLPETLKPYAVEVSKNGKASLAESCRSAR
jgi:hypothetical protein